MKDYMIKILVNATVVYTDSTEDHFDAICITNGGVFIGKIIEGKFADFGFIFKNSIKEIYNGKGKNRY